MARFYKFLVIPFFLTFLVACEHYYLIPEVDDIKDDVTVVKQSGEIIHIPYTIDFITKSVSTYNYLEFRYRIVLDGTVYGDYFISTGDSHSLSKDNAHVSLQLPVEIPENDSHSSRSVRVESMVQYLGRKDEILWEDDWTGRFEAMQDCLPARQPVRHKDLSGMRLELSVGGRSCPVSQTDSWTLREFKQALAAEMDNTLRFSVDRGLDIISLNVYDRIGRITENHCIETGMDHYGELMMENGTRNLAINLSDQALGGKKYTVLGRIDDKDFIDRIILGEDNEGMLTLSE